MGDDAEEVVTEHWRRARDAWPGIVIEPAHFAAEITRRGGAIGDKAVPLAALKATDLYLAIACVDGNTDAIEAVRALLTKEVEVAASRSTPSRDQIADAIANISRVLFVDDPPRAAALRDYTGRGDLKSYLRVIAMREIARIVNLGRREVGIDDAELLDRLVPMSDPEVSMLRAQYREIVDGSMRAALATLEDRDRALLRYAIVDGLSVNKIGELYNVHKATAARWIGAARARLGEKIREELATRLRVAEDEITSIIRLVQSRVDISLDRVLGTP